MEQTNHDGKSIAFAHYKNGELLGYRADTFGTLVKNWAKLYTYSKDQVKTVIDNINYSYTGERKPSLGEAIAKAGIASNVATDLVTASENKIYDDAQEAGAFEVRVVEAPCYSTERIFDVKTAEWKEQRDWTYPKEAVDKWLETPENHVVIETHYFTKVGKINLQ